MLASQLARNADRRLCYAVTLDGYLAEEEPITEPVFLDHKGEWQALVNLHPTSPFPRPPVRLVERPIENRFPF